MNPDAHRNLVVLGCSATKIETRTPVPAMHLYDGPAFRVFRSFLRDYRWPERLSLAVLSAKYGLIGSLSHIGPYNRRMTGHRAAILNPEVTETLQRMGENHRRINLVMGKDYLAAITLSEIPRPDRIHFASGSIGMKLNHLHLLLHSMPRVRRLAVNELERAGRPLYFLPDWDDFVDAEFDFERDEFSSKERRTRKEAHISSLTHPQRMCDGILVSLAQHLGSKGLLKRVGNSDSGSLAPKSVRKHFRLRDDQWAFGDCGAFSYVSEDNPTISVQQAVYLYDLYEFDMGASVDHIPMEDIVRDGKREKLPDTELKRRVRLTQQNADSFLQAHRAEGARFLPVGIIQGRNAAEYAAQVGEYWEMGYRHVALGGLVPRSDAEIGEIVKKVSRAFDTLPSRPWLHLLGIFRPGLQEDFRRWGVSSFDSATYFRKSWLRSGQNYLGSDGKWYAAIRVPPTKDPRTLKRLKKSRINEDRLKVLEQRALSGLHAFEKGKLAMKECLKRVKAYDKLLKRAETEDADVFDAYAETLKAKPWRKCGCRVCRETGIDVLIFRGLNRNKRRGAHNTLRLYRQLDNRS